MYKCDNCGCEFDEPIVVHEVIGECWGKPAVYDYGTCPRCGVDSYRPLHRCKVCGEWTADIYCRDCLTTATTMMMQMFERLANDRGIGYKDAVDLASEAMDALEG